MNTEMFYVKNVLLISTIFSCIGLYAEAFDLRTFAANKHQKHAFALKNDSKKMLRLKNIRTNCTCTNIKYLKSESLPDEFTELIVILNANSFPGLFTHSIYVETDSPRQRFMRFVIKRYYFSSVEWGAGEPAIPGKTIISIF